MTSVIGRLIDTVNSSWIGPSDERLPQAMRAVLDRLIDKINAAPIDPLPDDNIFMEEVFPPDVYAQILAFLPEDAAYDYIDHRDAVLPDGTKTRKLLDLTHKTLMRLQPPCRDFWWNLNTVLSSTALQRAITQKFRRRMDEQFGGRWPRMVSVPLFYRDLPGYRISIHPDAPFKIATMQFYFPRDNSQIHLGTSFHIKEGSDFRLWKTNEFKPNSAYAFVRTNNSWHSVEQLAPHEASRDTLALTIYRKGTEYKSDYYGSRTKTWLRSLRPVGGYRLTKR